jgi:hypothetical protein
MLEKFNSALSCCLRWPHYSHNTPNLEALLTTFFFFFICHQPFVNYFVLNISHRYGIKKYQNPKELPIELVFLKKKEKRNKQTCSLQEHPYPSTEHIRYGKQTGPIDTICGLQVCSNRVMRCHWVFWNLYRQETQTQNLFTLIVMIHVYLYFGNVFLSPNSLGSSQQTTHDQSSAKQITQHKGHIISLGMLESSSKASTNWNKVALTFNPNMPIWAYLHSLFGRAISLLGVVGIKRFLKWKE